MAIIETPEYHLSEGARENLVTELYTVALAKHIAGIDALVQWATDGFEGDAPVTKSLTHTLHDDLVDDLEWIFQAALPTGWNTSSYNRRFVKRRYATNARRAKSAETKSGMDELRNLLSF